MTLSMADWNPNLQMGEDEIDQQHQMLFQMIRELEARMADKQYLQGVLDALQGMKIYAAVHFEFEEGLMVRGGYPELARHMGMHAEYLWEIGRFEDEVRLSGEWASVEVLQFLVEWLVGHIQKEDVKFFQAH